MRLLFLVLAHSFIVSCSLLPNAATPTARVVVLERIITPTAPPRPTDAPAPPTVMPTATRLAATQAARTAVPPTASSSVNCPIEPAGSFSRIWQGDADLRTSLGCPTSFHPRVAPEAWQVKTGYQLFERGILLWSDHLGWYPTPVIYVLNNRSTYERFDDKFDPAIDSSGGSETPPRGLIEPLYGFGKLWRTKASVRAGVGWATAAEKPGSGRMQLFDGGEMMWISQTNQTFVFISRQGANQFRVLNIAFSE